ncbi:YqaJ viral recombinase family protein [Dyella sp.]|uniref:YqaJ viral recombinase family protein n=1 Tax=Dyella sp. TaxID=1869338 RepID=UPI002FDAF676
MKVLNLVQGTPEWHAHRATHFNASDAPAMLGASNNKKRTELLREVASGLQREFSDYVQERILDAGHDYEAKARAIAESIVGEDLYPCVGEEERYSASFDGLTLLEDTAFEHKSLNEALRAAFVEIEAVAPEHRERHAGQLLPELYRIQMEHQCLVSSAQRVLFMASKWEGDHLIEEHHCWYYPDLGLRDRIIAGWDQFAADVAVYQPEPSAAPLPIGRAPETLPALRIEVTGMVTASNLADFKAHAMAVLDGINRDLQTDEDFADAEQTVKWAKTVEDKLEAAKAHALSQTADIEAVFRTIDDVSAETRRIRLELDKLVKDRKEARRGEIVDAGRLAVLDHYNTLNATLGECALRAPDGLAHEMGAAIKGKRSIANMQEAINAAVANVKITANQMAERVRTNVAILADQSTYASLFPDRVQLCTTKAPEDLRNLIAARITEHRQHEQAKLDAQREQVRAEKAARQQSAQQNDTTTRAIEPEQASLPAGGGMGDYTGELRAAGEPGRVIAKPPTSTLRLGDINTLIAPLAITAEGLAKLGFAPVGMERAAKLYPANAFPAMCAAMQRSLIAAADHHTAPLKAA